MATSSIISLSQFLSLKHRGGQWPCPTPTPHPAPIREEGKSAKKEPGTLGDVHSPELPQPIREKETQLVVSERTPERLGEWREHRTDLGKREDEEDPWGACLGVIFCANLQICHLVNFQASLRGM